LQVLIQELRNKTKIRNKNKFELLFIFVNIKRKDHR
jgi:hypothetical protein